MTSSVCAWGVRVALASWLAGAAGCGDDSDPGIDGGSSDTPSGDAARANADAGASAVCIGLATRASLLISAAEATADRTCQTDADCGFLQVGVTCNPSCALAYASVAGQKQLQQALKAANEGTCVDYQNAGCAAPESITCVQGAPTARCLSGACEVPDSP